jgi:ribonuclease HI
MADELWTIHIDGAARGNPGPGAAAFVLERPGEPPIEVAETLGRTTNNLAEYSALLDALERAAELHGRRLAIFSDSELLVKQMNGEYRVKNEDLKGLYDQARALLRHFDEVTIRHVRRDENKRADQLCNRALDGAGPRTPSRAATNSAAGLEQRVRSQAVDCLSSAASAWATGNPGKPPPEAIWEQLWSLIEEAGILKKTKQK